MFAVATEEGVADYTRALELGGILGVANRQIGIGTYSPRLDRNGNSVRGVASYRLMSDGLGPYSFDLTTTGSGFVGSFFTSDAAES
ncbi:MAG: glutaminase [Proteobacteria bacterium]|nr:glutaminase [Pseudomonadota bacterium]